jgi:predicted ATP-binding protein involved in virulence
MPKVDFSDLIASEMNNVLNDEENMKLFSSSATLEKLAFKRVSEADQTTEVEAEMEKTLEKKASVNEETPSFKLAETISEIMKLSETLDQFGFESLAADTILLADALVKQAKGEKPKSKSEKSEKKSNEKSDKKSKKMDMKERMKKMREMKDKKKGKKSKPVSKKAQLNNPLLDNLMKHLPAELARSIHWKRFEVSQDNDNLSVLGEYQVIGNEANLLSTVQGSGRGNLSTYLSDTLKTIDPRVKDANIVKSF